MGNTEIATGRIERQFDDRSETPVDQQRERAVHYEDYKRFQNQLDPGKADAGQGGGQFQRGVYGKITNTAPKDTLAQTNNALADKANAAQPAALSWSSTALGNTLGDVFHSRETTYGLRAETHHDLGEGFDHANVTRVGAYGDAQFIGGTDGFDPAEGDLTGRASFRAQNHLGAGVVTEGSLNDDLEGLRLDADYRAQGGLEFKSAARGAAYAGPAGASAAIEGQLGVNVASAQVSGGFASDLDTLQVGDVNLNPAASVGARAFVGAEARGSAMVSLTPTHVGASVGGEAFVGAKAATYGYAGIGDLVGIAGGVEAYAGAGAKGGASLSFE
ncbi:MAG: hypothetical protein ACFCBW_05350, partial [Candidatus Competibacterales bacterium]